MQIRHISKCLNDKLNQICIDAIKLEELSLYVLRFLPPELQPHCQVGSFRAGKLVLFTSQPTWAMSLRYLAPELRDTLRSQAKLHQLISVEIKIQP